MSAHSWIEVGGHAMLFARGSWHPEIAALFTEDELMFDEERIGYVASAAQIRDRLQVLGFTVERANADLVRAVRVWHDLSEVSEGPDDAATRSAALIADLRRVVNFTSDERFERNIEYEDPPEFSVAPRAALRIAVELLDESAAPLRYNLDDLQGYELLKPGTPITEQAREDRTRTVATDAPLVILTEGSSDSQLLSAALQVTHPHLVGFLRFMDFGNGAEGSVNTLPKLMRSFIGAGIANRVLALADNDTAAHDALAKVKKDKLPDGYRILHYPSLELLAAYPTLGPQSDQPVVMDVNGLAAGLEMYLGQELLTIDGALSPVQWTGYVSGQNSYQGALAGSEKDRVQRAFRKKVEVALADPAVRAGQDWTGVTAIVGAILTAYDS